MYPHRIRLRGPWEYEPVARTAQPGSQFMFTRLNLPATGRMTMPCRWNDSSLGDFKGIVHFRRRFGYPGNIDANERVWLTIAGLTEKAVINLNGRDLGDCKESDCPCELEITALLVPRNELSIVISAYNDSGGLWGEVALEIRRTAFLRKVQAQILKKADCPCLTVTGELVGISDRPLDLYALLNGRTVAYATVQPAATGCRFELDTKECEDVDMHLAPNPSVPNVRLELIDGGVVWYAVEAPLAFRDS